MSQLRQFFLLIVSYVLLLQFIGSKGVAAQDNTIATVPTITPVTGLAPGSVPVPTTFQTLISPSPSIEDVTTSLTRRITSDLLAGGAASTTFSADSAPTPPPGSDFIDGSDNDAEEDNDADNVDDTTNPNAYLINYYFVFLVAAIIFAIGAGYLYYRRRKARKALLRRTSRDALSRDIQGWSSARPRRWIRDIREWDQERNEPRQDGLNELGEAPPPYVPNDNSADGHHEGNRGVSIPLQTLAARPEDRAKLPGYEEAPSRPTGRDHDGQENSNRDEAGGDAGGERSNRGAGDNGARTT
ncbi:hypothetical protein K402DRAFT_390543 [Aulographum hederae CBS 113979]|uniref:Uncharacterized protein n=1 Tax=Aulographum hederae CBS 113979 TaxID=1176131 RepID=A0A6G1H983_9PEZI|nr:hypothetical protein K402DRAFT_390543 [Aulographum hederae CBS 113979]